MNSLLAAETIHENFLREISPTLLNDVFGHTKTHRKIIEDIKPVLILPLQNKPREWRHQNLISTCGQICYSLDSFWVSFFSIQKYQNNLERVLSLEKNLCRYGRNTQICQLQGRGDSKPPYLYWNQIFFRFFLWKYFLMHMKPEGMTQFDIFHTFVEISLVENSVNSELLLF